jgi:uncharacterized coiled-coil protein SlyX
MRTRSLVFRLLLALCLLFAQQVLVAHAVAHTVKAASQQDTAPGHGKLCEACVLSAQLNDALVGQAALLVDVRAPLACIAQAVSALHPRPTRSYRSRAPPAHW